MVSSNTPLRSLLVGLLLSYPLPLSAQDNSACLIVSRFVQTYTVREQAVSINTDVLTNTTFYPIPQAPVTITNAPTSINTVSTFRWTQANVPMSIISSPYAPSTALAYPSLAQSGAMSTPYPDLGDYYVIAAMGARGAQKRQAGGVSDVHNK